MAIEDQFKKMQDYFKYRTGYHLWLVNKWSNRIVSKAHLIFPEDAYLQERIDLINQERDEHDNGKWEEPEYNPYVYTTWMYKCRREGVPFDIPKEIQDKMLEATFHHVKHHKHHPEYWDDNCPIDCINPINRDKPSGYFVDGTNMPLAYVAAMCADWFAMSEELNTNPKDWAMANVNVRWKFAQDQVALIYKTIEVVWPKS